MKRELEIREIGTGANGDTYFQILKQTHYGDEFTPEGRDFIASNKVRLCSLTDGYDTGSMSVRARGYNNKQNVYVMRSNMDEVNKALFAPPHIFNDIQIAVKEYNNAFAEEPEEPWFPGYGEGYWYIRSRAGGQGLITCEACERRKHPDDNMEGHNCFRTEEEARKVLKKLTPAGRELMWLLLEATRS